MNHRYVILTPLGSHKLYSIPEFLNRINGLDFPPDKLIFCIDSDQQIDILPTSPNITVLKNDIGIDTYPSSLIRICGARETLRKYFVKNTTVDHALWIDSDILISNNTIDKIFDIISRENPLLLNIGYPGRNGRLWHGGGLMATHKTACTLSRFVIPYIISAGKRTNIGSEDYIFIKLLECNSKLISDRTDFTTIRRISNCPPCQHMITEDDLRDSADYIDLK